MSNLKSIIALGIIGITLALSGCYYDNEAYLYGTDAPCDNSVITYTGRIKSIADNNCAISGCHSGPSPEDNISMEGYDNVKTATENTSVICAIQGQSGCSSMPKDRPLMSQCDVDAWKAWAAANYPN